MSLAKKLHLREDEKIIKIVRRYALPYAWKYAIGLVFLMGTTFFTFWLLSRGWWGALLFAAGLFAGIYILFRTWFFNNFTMFVITTDRVVDIYRLGWFDEVTSSVRYKDVADIAARRKGIFGSIFNYGLVSILTTTQNLIIDVESVRRPRALQAEIIEVMEWSQEQKRPARPPSINAIYGEFIKIIPELSDNQLEEVAERIEEQYVEDVENV